MGRAQDQYPSYFRCHEKTLFQWVKKGTLTAIRIGTKLKF